MERGEATHLFSNIGGNSGATNGTGATSSALIVIVAGFNPGVEAVRVIGPEPSLLCMMTCASP